jgi:uncharacterized protein involved in response to NO
MADWLTVYLLHLQVELEGVTIFQWHAHEMIFGYAMAVAAGFLLTAAWNWTGKRTADGAWLALLFLLWAAARVLMASGTGMLLYAAVADLAFMAGLGGSVIWPVIAAGQVKRQAPILLMLTLLTLANGAFYLGAAGWLEQGARLGVYGGLYLMLGMVLFMGRRVIPFFTQRGVDYAVRLRNERWVDISMFVVYPLFMLSEIFRPFHLAGAILAGMLLFLNSRRLMGWHTLGIWQKPLLWGLFAAFIMINLGFLMRAMMAVTVVPDFLPVHGYALGGIGIVTLTMMSRVSLGHTGRDVHHPPRLVAIMLVFIISAAFIRIFLPLADPANYPAWVAASGIIWIISFVLFTIAFAPMLLRKRLDA